MHLSDASRVTVLIWIVAVALGAVAVIRLADSGGSGTGAPVRIDRSPGSDAAPGSAAGRAGQAIYVHVAGAVHRPGLVRLRAGSRVAVAIERAGGPRRRADLSGVNLAASLEDGQQVVVPMRGAVAAAGGAATADAVPGAAGAPKASLGTATIDQLDEIDGIGPTLAQRIVEYRTEHGGFKSVQELREVEGIGEKRFETLSEALQP